MGRSSLCGDIRTMTFHRFAYKVCWKNRIVVPLVLIFSTFTLVSILRDTSIEYHSSGKFRLKYYLPGTKAPLEENKDDAKQQVPVLHRKMAFERPANSDRRSFRNGEEEVKLAWENDHLHIIEEKTFDDGMRRDNDAAFDNEFVAQSNKFEHRLNVLPGDQSVTDEKNPRKIKGRKKFKSRLKFKPVWRKTVYYNVSNQPEMFKTWRTYEDSFCNKKFVGYFNEFAVLKDVKVDLEFCNSTRKGGEKIQSVLNQAEESEYFTYDVGCFQQTCKQRPSYYFNNNNHMNDWLYSLKTHSVSTNKVDFVQKNFVIAIVRYEYVNLYHTMSDWYNAFLVMQFFNKTQWDTNIVLVDTHPQGSLDSVWLALFNTTRRMTTLPKTTLFSNMVWNMIGYNSPLLDHYGPGLPLVEEFRNFFLTSFDIADDHRLRCGELNVLFIWRRDYVAHPRNPTGSISRKVQNERELMKSVQEKYPKFNVRGVQIDLFDMQKQLNLVVETDLLIGMHGAGLTHALFLPKHAGLIELIPNYWSAANDHFYAISQWRKLWYERWVNEDPHNEVPDNYTKVPPSVLLALLKSVMKGMCYGS